jgi:hypothetical protein
VLCVQDGADVTSARPCIISRPRWLPYGGRGPEYLRLEGVFAYPVWTTERGVATVMAHPMACLWADALRSKEGRRHEDQPSVEFVT